MSQRESDLTAKGVTGACPTEAAMSQAFHKGHDGVDLPNRKGTPIFAVADGVVTDSGPAQGYGQWIRIRHDDGSMTESGHMYQRDVKVGERVRAGQRIALMGSEGQSTGPHLHLRTYASAARTGTGNGMNPVEYLRARGVTLPCKPGVAAAAAAAAPAQSSETLPAPSENALTSVNVSWNRISPTAEYSLDLLLKNGDLIAPCVDEYKIGTTLSYGFAGSCVSPKIPVKMSDVRDFRICSAENNDWARAVCTDAKWDGTSGSVKIEN